MLTREQFDRIRNLALRLTGIELFERHREPICARLRRLGLSTPSALDGLLDAAEAGEAWAVRQSVRVATTSFTGFFRHPWHFDIAAEHALWVAHRQGQARLWSAAAATGEEPYSLAMALIDVFHPHAPPVTILGSDIDDEALAAADRGEYSENALRTLNSEQRTRFFMEASAQGRSQVDSRVRRLVQFCNVNLASAAWPVEGPFSVIFCRNVLMYLQPRYREDALKRMAALLEPDGVLILDPAEHAGSAEHLFTAGTNGVYSLPRASSATRRPGKNFRNPRPISHGI